MTLSTDALYELVRSLADRGEDFGYNVYYNGTTISLGKRRQMIKDDDQAQAWLDAFDYTLNLYTTATGEKWSY